MGHWNQRRRAGGDSRSQNWIVSAFISGVTFVRASYKEAVDAASFPDTGFTTQISDQNSIAITQITPKLIEIEFNDPVAGDTSLTFSGIAPQILSPQTVFYV